MATGLPRRERWSNTGSSTLNGALSVGATSLVVTSAASFPTAPDFRLSIENEILLVTAISGTTFTVERGQEGTTDTTHADATAVYHYLTEDSVTRAFQDAFSLPDYPYNRILDAGGNTLNAASFTWFNQGSATAVDADDGGLKLTLPNETGRQIRGKWLTAPSAPWVLTSYVMLGPGFKMWNAVNGTTIGLIAEESSTGKLYYLKLRNDRIILERMTNYTTFSANVNSFIENGHHEFWLRLEDDNTDVKGHVSRNGYDWVECFSEGRTAFLAGGANRIGFGCESDGGAAGAHFYVKTWIVE
jgi:hypothetical protein